MRSFMQTLCHCETNPSDSSPHSGVNTCLNSDPGRIMALLSLVSLFFIACLMRKAEYLVRAFFNVATFWSPESRSGVKWCDEQLHPSDAPLSRAQVLNASWASEKRQCAPWTHCGQNPLLLHGMSFHVRFMCLCFFATRESFYALLLAKFYQMSNLYSLDRWRQDFWWSFVTGTGEIWTYVSSKLSYELNCIVL